MSSARSCVTLDHTLGYFLLSVKLLQCVSTLLHETAEKIDTKWSCLGVMNKKKIHKLNKPK